MVKINEEKLPELARIYNEGGKSALYCKWRPSSAAFAELNGRDA
jgi:hypothetical protein